MSAPFRKNPAPSFAEHDPNIERRKSTWARFFNGIRYVMCCKSLQTRDTQAVTPPLTRPVSSRNSRQFQ